MLYFRTNLANPWFKIKESKSLENIFLKEKRLSRHKFLEIQFSKIEPWDFFSLLVDMSFRGKDHAGFAFDISFWNLSFMINVYDNRHWNYETNTWMNENEHI